MEEEKECPFLRLAPDGSIIVELDGREQALQIAGIATKLPLPAIFGEVIDRVVRMGRSLRCIICEPMTGTPLRARVLCFGWQDKSGDVWLDLAELLITEGAAEAEEQ